MKNKRFEKAFTRVLDIEKEYSNDPADSGGKTKFGITEWLARRYDYQGNMKYLTLRKAKEIAYKEFWQGLRCDKIDCFAIAFELFEQVFNIGNRKLSVRWLQESYNLVTRNNIATDGILGPNTLAAINSYDKPRRIAKFMNLKQGNYYMKLAEQDQSQEKFVFGWIDKRVRI